MMARYDFKSLSPQDFEELTRDLLQAEWGVAIEAFKTGRDQGIDLRYARGLSNGVVVQCKHYASSSFSSLLSHLRDVELPKVKLLKPDRYLVVTSLSLTKAEKDKIVAAMAPFILSLADVIGADDLNGLLSRHDKVEKSNFKLWLTNTEVVSRILHNAEVCQTKFEVERIRQKLPVFVQSQAYPRALKILDDQRVVIISGVPGIGKTTLAEMLLFAHLDDGYEPVVIQSDLIEGKRLFDPTRKQIFYYDDFLGQTFLGDQRTYLGRNQDVALLSFLEMVKTSPDSRFVLTTREHILQQAVQASERFQHSAAKTYKCVLDLGDYTFGQRARILYNHIYFSDLPNAHKQVLLEDDFFLKVIKHRHFNPRLIEWIASLARLNSPPAQNYCAAILSLLESPEQIWSHAFRNQISDSARDLLLTMYSMGEWGVQLDELKGAFEVAHKGACERYTRPRGSNDFRLALDELDGSFLQYSNGRASFLNPTIRDFTAGVFCGMPALVLEIIEDSARFQQIGNLWRLSQQSCGENIRAALAANSQTLITAAGRFSASASMQWISGGGRKVGHFVDTQMEWRLNSIIEWCEAFKEEHFVDLARAFAQSIPEKWKTDGTEFGAITQLLDTMKECPWFLSNGGMHLYRFILDSTLARLFLAGSTDWRYIMELRESAIGWTPEDEKLLRDGLSHYRCSGVDEERENCGSVSTLTELVESLTELDSKYSLGFARTIADIQQEIDEREERQNSEDEDGGGYSSRANSGPIDPTTEDDVREMFNSLRA